MRKFTISSVATAIRCGMTFLFVSMVLGFTLAAGPASAQAQRRTVKGEVVDKDGNPLPAVLVDLKESLISTLTDREGRFEVQFQGKYNTLIFSLDGYNEQSVVFGKENYLKVILTQNDKAKDRDIYLMYGKQKQSKITSAVSTVWGEEIEDIPVMFQNAALTGRLPGVLTIQESGAPGQDNADLYLRGRRSWQNRNPLVFIDGHRRDFSLVDPHEIEQISAFKDAGALAILGLRGGNGALMMTTKRGIEGRPVLSWNSQVNIQYPTRLPDFLDSWHYATLYNEAMLNDDPTAEPRYKEEDLNKYLTGESPYTHPNVDWLDESLKKASVSQRHNLSIRGGSSAARYFVNLSFMNNDGLYKTDKDVNTYNTNAGFKMYSIRSNVDVNLTKTTLLALSLYGRQRVQNNPGATTTTNALFNTLYSIPSNIFPLNYGSDKVAGTNEFRNNPYGILNHSGYSKYIHSTMESSIEMRENMDYFVKGLSVHGALAFDLRFDNTINRSKTYPVYQYKGVDEFDNPIFDVWGEEKPQNNSNSFGSRKIRIFDVEVGVDYNRVFGKHDVAATLMYNNNQESDDTEKLTNFHQGVFGRATYVFGSRYIAEFSFAYQGSEQLPPDNRYGFFPAGSVGWVLSEEPFIKRNIGNVLSFMKLRASYGLSGNDDGIPYYYYLPSFKLNSSNRYNFGVTGTNVAGWVEDGLYNEHVTWEESKKLNLGADIRLFKDRLSLGFDYFDEQTSQILTERMSVSSLLGMGAGTGPLGNVGKTKNRGYEAQIAYTDHYKDFWWTVGGNIAYARNEILFNDEQAYAYNYRKTVGHSINDIFGYVANGLYFDEQDMLNSPSTSFGTAFPGDIKYRDLNGDGIVDNQDQKRLGHSNLAETNYAFFVGLNWKGFDFNMLFTGVANRNYYMKNTSAAVIAFYNVAGTGGKYDGNVQQYHWDHRYNPSDPSTWKTATYPRLSLAGRDHNTQQSSFWLENGNFLRLKNLEVGYTLPRRITQKWYISKARIFYSGYNLATWDNMRMLDPESGPNANNYPVQVVHSIGINIQF